MDGKIMWHVAHKIDDILIRLTWIPSTVFLIAFCIILFQAADRKPPFEILSVEPAAAKAGEMVVIRAKVWRDGTRNCSVSMSRSVFDASNTRFDYPIQRFSDAVIDDMEKKTPNRLAISVMVPSNAAAGQANLVSILDYRCNKVHYLWPIEVTTSVPFTVLE